MQFPNIRQKLLVQGQWSRINRHASSLWILRKEKKEQMSRKRERERPRDRERERAGGNHSDWRKLRDICSVEKRKPRVQGRQPAPRGCILFLASRVLYTYIYIYWILTRRGSRSSPGCMRAHTGPRKWIEAALPQTTYRRWEERLCDSSLLYAEVPTGYVTPLLIYFRIFIYFVCLFVCSFLRG